MLCAPGEKKPDLGCRKPVRATGAPSARDCAGHGASGLDGQHLLLLGSLWGTHNAELFPTVQAQEPLKHRSLCTTQPQVTGNPGRRCVHQRQCLWVPGARPGSRTQQLCRLPAAYKQEMSGVKGALPGISVQNPGQQADDLVCFQVFRREVLHARAQGLVVGVQQAPEDLVVRREALRQQVLGDDEVV